MFRRLRPRFVAAAALLLTGLAVPAFTQFPGFSPGNLVVSRSVYTGTASTVTVGQPLPPKCPAGNAGCTNAIANGTYPGVWANNGPDGSFGVTSPIFLDHMTTGGVLLNTLAVDPTQLVTSFSSKSEIALNLSTDGTAITFMGYVSTPNQLDVSNSGTPGVVDPTNPVGLSVYRGIAQVNAGGFLQVTENNAYSGNNGRAAILANGTYYMVGNSNNGTGTPANVVAAAGAQGTIPSTLPEASQAPGAPTILGSFDVTQINPLTGKAYNTKADKAGKDNNFRGLTVFNNTLYVTKGSGSNGIDTVYQIGNAGSLPTLAGNAPITVLPGFNVVSAKTATAGPNPFGIWFANANTLYVADEGDGTPADAATSPFAGLEKWSLVSGVWHLDYVLQNGLNLGQQYGVPNYPANLNPATDGLRNITGRVNEDGTVTIWGITSTVSANGDQGADPNQLVMITDVLANTSAAGAAGEQFTTLRTAQYGEVLRGVSFTPGTVAPAAPPSMPVTSSGLIYNRRTATFYGTVTVTNNTSSTVTGPLAVSITNLTAGVTLNSANPVPVLASGATLNPGQSASGTVSFSDPTNVVINFTPVVVP